MEEKIKEEEKSKEEETENERPSDEDVIEYIDAVLAKDYDMDRAVFNCVINMMDLLITGVLNDYTDEGKEYIKDGKEKVMANSYLHKGQVCMAADKETFGFYSMMFGYYFGIRRQDREWIDDLIIDNYTDYAKDLEDISGKIDEELAICSICY